MVLLFRFSLLLFTFAFIACDTNKSELLPGSTGKSGEVIVVIAQNHWESSLGSAIRKVLAQPYPALPQEESLFNVVNVKTAAFKGILRRHKNILYLDIRDSSKEAMVKKKEVWAKGQIVVTIYANNNLAAAKLILSRSQKLISYFADADRYRLMKGYSKIKNKKVIDELEKNLQIKLSIPMGYDVASKANRFMWIRKETGETSQGLFIYDYPYTDKKSFSVESIVHFRDSLTRAYVPGALEGSYMKVVKEFPPVVKEVSFNDNYAIEVRGLWDVEGDFMGGPYLSYTILDIEHNRVICAEAYVYAPKFSKRDYLRQMEAILLTLKFAKK
ncbi:MAG: hypothetical protein COB85_02430 [Bacteroidetes bacterium]|nr:MAG: hypothetical protein COB85_02430 [Bacteroidota bacterium]